MRCVARRRNQGYAMSIESAIAALVDALVKSKGWLRTRSEADAIVRHAIDREIPKELPGLTTYEVVSDITEHGIKHKRVCDEAVAIAYARDAVAAERERCAKIARRFEPDERSSHVTYASDAIRGMP